MGWRQRSRLWSGTENLAASISCPSRLRALPELLAERFHHLNIISHLLGPYWEYHIPPGLPSLPSQGSHGPTSSLPRHPPPDTLSRPKSQIPAKLAVLSMLHQVPSLSGQTSAALHLPNSQTFPSIPVGVCGPAFFPHRSQSLRAAPSALSVQAEEVGKIQTLQVLRLPHPKKQGFLCLSRCRD